MVSGGWPGYGFRARFLRSTASLEARMGVADLLQLLAKISGRAGPPQCGCCTLADPDGLRCDQLWWRAVSGLDCNCRLAGYGLDCACVGCSGRRWIHLPFLCTASAFPLVRQSFSPPFRLLAPFRLSLSSTAPARASLPPFSPLLRSLIHLQLDRPKPYTRGRRP